MDQQPKAEEEIETIDDSAAVVDDLTEEEVISEMVELDDIETEVILKDGDLLNYLDKTALEILASNGYPDTADTYQGSLYWFFSENDITFFFDVYYYDKDLPLSIVENARVLGIASRKLGAECYGAKIGMTFSEIEFVMGHKGKKYEDHESDNVILHYHMLIFKEDINDIELRFYAEDDKSPTKSVLIIWKGYEREF